ncbi:efflux pump antibiotic resistance protein [Venturia nashicola]|uniref:Efflux pump antibiotic resistance protein n=1 Tax=Venturia nashicola TaxID=86259 RepID=A0A4Z1NV52_9PEZI|nr:efflux pump antibiotic resistance protein [Venturia nashicola]
MAAEVPRRRLWSSIFSPSSFQKPKDVNARISLPFLDITDPIQVELQCASLSSDLSKHELNKEDSESTMVQSNATPSTDHTLTVQRDGNTTVSQNHDIHVDDITVTPVRHAREKSLASDFKFGGDEMGLVPSSHVPPIPDLPPRIAPLFSRNTSVFSTRSSVPSVRRPPRFDPRGFCRPEESLRHWRSNHLPHISTGSSLYSTDTAFWSQLPAFEERYPHLQRPQFPIPRAPWPPIHPLAQSYENIISPMLLNYVAHPTLAAIVDTDSPVSEVAAIEDRFSSRDSRDTYLDQSERWESMYHGTFESEYAQSDYHSDARSDYQSDAENAHPTHDLYPPAPDSPISSKEREDELPESFPRDGRAPVRLGIVLFSLWFGNLLVSLQDTMVPIALPSISSDLHGLEDVAEYLSWYLLAFTVAYPISHKLYRLFDGRVVYLFAVILFAVGNGFCGSATSSPYLVWCRTIAGIGSAALLQGSTSIIEFMVPAGDINNSLIGYVRFVESAYAFSLAIGPVLAGVIVDRLDWRWCFWINAISGTCLFILVALFFRRCSTHDVQCKRSIYGKLKSLDYLGLISFSGALFCLLLALRWAGLEHAWTSVTTLGLLFAFLFLLILLVFVEWIQDDEAILPTMTLRREVLWSSLFLFCAYGNIAMISLYIPFYFQAGQGTSAMVSGIRNLPLALPSIAAIVLAVGTSFRGRHCVSYILVGQIVTTLGLTFFSTQGKSNDPGVWLVLLSIIGFGLGITTLLPYFMLGGIFE